MGAAETDELVPFDGPGDPRLSLLRIVAQRLVGSDLRTAGEVVDWMGCLQGQELPGALRSVELRRATQGGAAARDERDDLHDALPEVAEPGGVVDALERGEVVRSWPMRGTLHLVPARDAGWICDLTWPSMHARTRARRSALQLDDADLDHAGALAIDLLTGGRRVQRAELVEAWEQAGLCRAPQAGYHLLFALAAQGLLCQGPLVRLADGRVSRSEQQIVLREEWVRNPRRFERDEALATWLGAYARSHGPVTVKDAQRWTGLGARDVRQGLQEAAGLTTQTVAGQTYYVDTQLPERFAGVGEGARGLLLLPGFDELVLGYADRTCTVPAEHAQAVVPGNNGVFRPTVVLDGRAIGTWKPRTEPIQMAAFAPLTSTQRRTLAGSHVRAG